MAMVTSEEDKWMIWANKEMDGERGRKWMMIRKEERMDDDTERGKDG